MKDNYINYLNNCKCLLRLWRFYCIMSKYMVNLNRISLRYLSGHLWKVKVNYPKVFNFLSNFQIIFFIIGRIICGMCSGAFCVLTPIYVAEIADKEIRGRLLMFFQLFVNCGVMYAFVIAYVIDEDKTVWRYGAI